MKGNPNPSIGQVVVHNSPEGNSVGRVADYVEDAFGFHLTTALLLLMGDGGTREIPADSWRHPTPGELQEFVAREASHSVPTSLGGSTAGRSPAAQPVGPAGRRQSDSSLGRRRQKQPS
jgi:hypothetical protein